MRLATAVVGIAVASGFAMMVWDATHSKGLIIEPFAVPPEMAGRGLTGQVLATQMLDRLASMSARESSRAVQSYANNWGNNIKVEIPETGVSIGELRRFLTEWLGHDIRISGEVYRTTSGIAITARVGSEAGATFEGAETDLNTLVQKSAEHVYETTQPYRFANYLDRNYSPDGLADRVTRSRVIYRKLIAGDDPVERAWAWNGLGTSAWNFDADERQGFVYYRKSLASTPDFTIAYFALASRELLLGIEEDALRNFRIASRLLSSGAASDLNPHYVPYARLSAADRIASYTGDFGIAIALAKEGYELPDDFSVLGRATFSSVLVFSMVGQHDLSAFHTWLHDQGLDRLAFSQTTAPLYIAQEKWSAIAAEEMTSEKRVAASVGTAQYRRIVNGYNYLRPSFALARAELGDFAAAEKLIAPVASDNDEGLRIRATIAEMQGQHARADWWFARSEKQTPSIPFTDQRWGRALLRRGQPDAAIEKFKLSHRKGPHFADPLEGWGEALMAKNQSHLALAKFAEAEKYAPNWGRLHLKWGEALYYAGNRDDAKAQFARAAALDLTPSEKSEMAKVPHV